MLEKNIIVYNLLFLEHRLSQQYYQYVSLYFGFYTDKSLLITKDRTFVHLNIFYFIYFIVCLPSAQ